MNATRVITWLRHNGWVTNLVFILLGSYFVAGAANSVVARTLRVMPSEAPPPVQRMTQHNELNVTKVEYTAMAGRNLFAAQRENLKPVVETPPEADPMAMDGKIPPDNELRPCTLAVSLRGTMVADGAPEWSVAVMFNSAKNETQIFNINPGSNQIADDAVLAEIRNREVVVRRRDHFELCPAEGEGGSRPAGMAPPPAPTRPADDNPAVADASPPPPSDPGDRVRKTGETGWELDKSYLENDILNNLSNVATQARIVPSFKNGKPNGFKLFSIQPGSFYAKIGLQNGDVINKINGYEMNSPDKALEVYQKLRDATSISVELQRRGQNVSHSYAIK